MTKTLTAAVVTLSLATSAAAQSVTTVDLSALNLGGVLTMPQAIETDGNPDTQEWLIGRLFSAEYRVIAVTPAGLCVGAPFSAGADWRIQRVGRVDKLTRLTWPTFAIMDILHPRC